MNDKTINYAELADRVIKKLKDRTEKKTVEMKFVNKVPGLLESKIGGIPFMPQGGEWPLDKITGKKLYLLIQINFAEVPALPDYPEKGILQIFIADDDLYGMDVKVGQYQDGWRIRFYEDISDPMPVEEIQKMMPKYDETACLPFEQADSSCGIVFEERSMLISTEDYKFDSMFDEIMRSELPEDELLGECWEYPDEFKDKIYETCNGAGSRLGGYPFFTQWDCRDKESNEILLLQIDSFGVDGEWFLAWGDGGVANFFITEDDLKNREFSHVNYNWDCT